MKEIIRKLSTAEILSRDFKDKGFSGEDVFGLDAFTYDLYLPEEMSAEEVEDSLLKIAHGLLDLILLTKLQNIELLIEPNRGAPLKLEQIFVMTLQELRDKKISEDLVYLFQEIKKYIHSANIKKYFSEIWIKGEVDDSLDRVYRLKGSLLTEDGSTDDIEKESLVQAYTTFYLGVCKKFAKLLLHDHLLSNLVIDFSPLTERLISQYSKLSPSSTLYIFADIVVEAKTKRVSAAQKTNSITHLISIAYTLAINVLARGFLYTDDVSTKIYNLIDTGNALLKEGCKDTREVSVFFDKALIVFNTMKLILESNVFERGDGIERFSSSNIEVLKHLHYSDSMDGAFRNLYVMARKTMQRKPPQGNGFSKRLFITDRNKDPREVSYIRSNRGILDIPDEYWHSLRGQLSKEIGAKRLRIEQYNGKLKRRDTGFTSSFVFFNGKPYAISEKGRKFLGTGMSHLKFCQDRDGVNYALKIGRLVNPDQMYAMRQERRILAELGELLGGFTALDTKKEYILTNLYPGTNLIDGYIKTGIIDILKLSYEVAIKCAQEIKRLHDIGIIHRDIKPDNFMAWFEGGIIKVRVIDFGISVKLAPGKDFVELVSDVARVEEEDGEIRNIWGGTPGYMAPESILEGKCTKGYDIYSLGAMFEGSLDIKIPEMTAEDPSARPDITTVIDYLKYASKQREYTSLSSWVESEAGPVIYEERDSISFAHAFDLSVAKYNRILSKKEEVVRKINSICPISLDINHRISAERVRLV